MLHLRTNLAGTLNIEKSLYNIKGILDIHELHVWAITSNRISLTAHIVIDPSYDCESVLSEARERLSKEFGVTHTTLQHERKTCIEEQGACHF